MTEPRIQAMFKRSRHSSLSIFIFSQKCYEVPKRFIGANRNIYHIFKSKNIGEVQNLCQGKACMDMSLEEFKNLLAI